MRIRLCDVDREKFGCDEWLDLDPLDITVADIEELCGRFGFDPHDWPEPFFGALTLDQAGDPGARPKPPPWQQWAAVWMALRQAGLDVSWDQAGQARPWKARVRPGPGKDDPDPDLSASSGPSTTTPSGKSST